MFALEESFRILRVSLVRRFADPALFTVTSADAGDGTAYVATGLARAFAETGEKTLLISASGRGVAAELGLRAGRGEATSLGTLARSEVPSLHVLITDPALEQQHAMSAALGALRGAYRAIVVDAAPVPASASAYRFASASDGVIVALRLGRKPVPADRELLSLLAQTGTETIGVIPTRGRAAAYGVMPTPAMHPVTNEYEGKPRVPTTRIEVAR